MFLSGDIRRVISKFHEDGLLGTLIAVLGRIQRRYRRLRFIFLGTLFHKLGFFQTSFKFVGISISNVDLNEYPAEKIYAQINGNRYQILEGSIRDWGRSDVSGEVHWDRDLINQYVWNSKAWGIDLAIPLNSGDIKRPWELGRLHQLVQLAFCYRRGYLKNEVLNLATKILTDFNINNTEFRGPQWMCAMDVGIRVANISLAASLFGKDFIERNQRLLNYEIARHVFFIESNLENSLGTAVGNHFYANLTGLIFAYAHTAGDKGGRFLKKYAKMINKETLRQFGKDGGNFEGSTFYHRLSGELALFSYAILSSRLETAPYIDDTVRQRLNAISFFSRVITLPDKTAPQIGDNDSGHLFILNPLDFQATDLKHVSLVNGFESFFANENQETCFRDVLQSFLNNSEFLFPSQKLCLKQQVGNPELINGFESNFLSSKSYQFAMKKFDSNSLNFYSFPEFGLYVAKTEGFYFYARVGINPVDEHGGHRHRDQLSVFVFDGGYLMGRDPGSYLYTSNVEQRNKFRAAKAHNGPFVIGRDDFEKSLFEMGHQDGKCLYFGLKGFVGLSMEHGNTLYRVVRFGEDALQIVDGSTAKVQLADITFAEPFFSERYGSLS
ncbi:heparinase II/III family protein [Bdellovibrio bacteriovorus]|uniref:heparinase II/III domain-containing protein n=1 Tax=Bdellovibrio bacteriovorus TaxID=959 RepID=UPI0035A65D1F